MAGIGFVLRKLLKKDTLLGTLQAYLHATLATSGAWLFTVIALGSFYLVFKNWNPIEIENFRIIILYNFSFSLVLAAPISLLSTRYLADSIYKKNVDNTVGMLIGGLMILFTLGLPISAAFYLLYAKFPLMVALLAIVNFMVICAIWFLSVFISALQYYILVTMSFLLGMIFAVANSVVLGVVYSLEGMLLGFTLGQALILSSLIALVLTEYPKRTQHLFDFLRYLKEYRLLILGGLIYNLAIWVDKWIMWFAPEAVKLPNNLIMYPHYDAAMFLAYLTIVPGMAMFLLSQETSFFEKYIQFYDAILNHAPLKKIQSNHQMLLQGVYQSGRNLLLLQVCICVITLLLAPKIFGWLGLNFIELGIFRYGVLGSTFQILSVYLSILLSYFDYRKGVFWIQVVFFSTNALFTLVCMKMGFSYYGYGYFLSTLVTFITAAIIAETYINKLPYHTFITTNASVQE